MNVLSCKEGIGDEFESTCKGLHLSKENHTVIIESDSCWNGCYKLVYRKIKTFPDNSFLTYDEVLMCADKELLKKIAEAIQKCDELKV